MKRIAVAVCSVALLAACGGAPTVEVASAGEWCTQYDALVAENLVAARQWTEDPSQVSATNAEHVRDALASEQALAEAAGEGGYLPQDLVALRVRLGNEAVSPVADRFVDGLNQGGPLGNAVVARAYATLMSDADRIAREAGYENAEDAVNAYGAAIDVTCGFNPVDRVDEGPAA